MRSVSKSGIQSQDFPRPQDFPWPQDFPPPRDFPYSLAKPHGRSSEMSTWLISVSTAIHWIGGSPAQKVQYFTHALHSVSQGASISRKSTLECSQYKENASRARAVFHISSCSALLYSIESILNVIKETLMDMVIGDCCHLSAKMAHVGISQ